jgi:hypothetical protein
VGQQLSIVVLVDVAAAVDARTLEGNTYLFDTMRFQGSEGEGTGDLVTAVNGTHWVDGSQADEQVLNWVPVALGSIPPTVPRNYHASRARHSERQALVAFDDLVARSATDDDIDVAAELRQIHSDMGVRARVTGDRHGGARSCRVGHRGVDITGNIVVAGVVGAHATPVHPALQITDIRGEAVEENVMFPAQYGSPDLISEGWYWSATVDTSRVGTYAYTMEIELHQLTKEDEDWVWEPIRMSYQSHIRVSSEPKRNGFTKAGIGMLPIPVPVPPAAPPVPPDASSTPGVSFAQPVSGMPVVPPVVDEALAAFWRGGSDE